MSKENVKRWTIAVVVSGAAAIFISRLPPEAVPGASPVYLLAVVLASFEGGFGPGLLGAAIVLGHSAYYRVCVAPPSFHFGCLALESLVLGAPMTALLVGWLRRQADRRLAEATRTADALSEAQRIGGVGSFEWDCRSGTFDCSEEFVRLLGLGAGVEGLDEWVGRVAPEDRTSILEALERVLEREQATVEFRVPAAGARERCLRLRVARAADGRVRGTVHEVTDEKLALEVEAIKRRDVLQRELIANVSHEFRTPLAAIRGFTDTLQADTGVAPEVRAEFLGIIGRHTERLSRLVESLLDLAILESGTRPPVPSVVELAGFLHELREGLAPLAGRQGVKIEVHAARDCRAFIDAEHLIQIVSNLCDNAIKYNRRGGRVALSAAFTEDAVVVRVEDTGPGIPRESIPHLFERFSQRKRQRPDIGGAGLGLSIAASLAQANCGRLSVERTGPSGTCFLLQLPAAKESMPPARVQESVTTPLSPAFVTTC